MALCVLAAGCRCAFALNPALDISQYGHDQWTVRSGFIKGNIYTIAQTPDGYLWLGTEFGIFRFDGIRTTPWAATCGSASPWRRLQATQRARRDSLDWHVSWDCDLERMAS